MPRNASAIFLNTHPFSYRRGDLAKIVGVRMAKPRGREWRPCYVLEFADGEQDLHRDGAQSPYQEMALVLSTIS